MAVAWGSTLFKCLNTVTFRSFFPVGHWPFLQWASLERIGENKGE